MKNKIATFKKRADMVCEKLINLDFTITVVYIMVVIIVAIIFKITRNQCLTFVLSCCSAMLGRAIMTHHRRKQ